MNRIVLGFLTQRCVIGTLSSSQLFFPSYPACAITRVLPSLTSIDFFSSSFLLVCVCDIWLMDLTNKKEE